MMVKFWDFIGIGDRMGKQLEIDACFQCKHFKNKGAPWADWDAECHYFNETNPIYEEDLKEHILRLENPETIPKECPLPPYQTNIVCDMSRELPDYYAEIEILEFLRKGRDSGEKEFDVLDLIFATNLPPEQINRILEKLQKKKMEE